MTGGAMEMLVRVLRGPALPPGVDWEAVVHDAREADLLGSLARRMRARGLLDQVPHAPRAHLIAAETACRAQHAAVWRELGEIGQALRPLGVPLVLLKGAAYVAARLPAAEGRSLSDIDLLVPREALPAVESALMLAGFATSHHHPHDQRYYRSWMHEIPPMQHVKRLTILDVHHAIVPQRVRERHDARLLLRDCVTLAEPRGFSVLAPQDMVIHSVTHLFRNEEFTHGLRDLVDLDTLLRDFGRTPGFWPALPKRAAELRLGRPLYYALQCASRILGTPVPAHVMSAAATYAPGPATDWLMRRLLHRALRPHSNHPSVRWARRALYVRGHWLKLPMPLLAWHLTAKALRREQPA